MVSRIATVSFQGIEAVPVDVQVMIAPGKVNMQIIYTKGPHPDKGEK